MSRKQQVEHIKHLEAVQERIVSGENLGREDRIACWYGMQARINALKEFLYGMEYIWDHKQYAPEGYVAERIKSEAKPCPLGETARDDPR